MYDNGRIDRILTYLDRLNNNNQQCEILGSHSGVAENPTLRGCDADIGQVVPDVSTERTASIFRIKKLKKNMSAGKLVCYIDMVDACIGWPERMANQ
jgi:hypothetical protein